LAFASRSFQQRHQRALYKVQTNGV
jgi:hypothetical protein